MKRLGYALGVAAVLLAGLPFPTHSAGRFDQKLSADKQIIHVLNRLTFGPRADDAAEVRRMGVEKWIDQQLHPDRLTENPVLDARLEPFTTLQLATWQMLEKYPQAPAAFMIRPPSAAALQSLSPLQRAKLTSGSGDERRTTLAALDPETRRLVLAGAPPQMCRCLHSPCPPRRATEWPR